MRIVGINGSPRKGWNTALMVESALRGATDAGVDTVLYHLSDIDFNGCMSCFACLRTGAPTYGKCSYGDALMPVLEDVLSSDGLVIGSPVYFGDVTARVRAFLERLWFGGLSYNPEHFVVYERKIPVTIILTTNTPTAGFHETLNKGLVDIMGRFLGPTTLIEANDTLQFDDYSLYDSAMFDPAEKLKSRNEKFPEDLNRAYRVGKELIGLNR